MKPSTALEIAQDAGFDTVEEHTLFLEEYAAYCEGHALEDFAEECYSAH